MNDYGYKHLSNFESMSVTAPMSAMTLSSTQDALREGAKGAVSKCFTFEMIADSQSDLVK